MSFFELRDCDFITTVYTANPDYQIVLSQAVGTVNPFLVSSPFFVFNSTSVGIDRTFSDLEGNPVTSSFNLSGVVSFVPNVEMSASERRSIDRLRNTYASASLIKFENYESSSIFNPSFPPTEQDYSILNIPQILYGSEIQPGSVFLRTNGGAEYTDDSYGGVFSGNLHVGCVFYQHGIVLFGSKFVVGGLSNITASFSGTMKMPMNMYLCRVPRGSLNFSQNPSYTSLVTGSNRNEISTSRPKTFITGVGLYDEDYKLLGVAKISSPILNEEDTGLLFRLKLVI